MHSSSTVQSTSITRLCLDSLAHVESMVQGKMSETRSVPDGLGGYSDDDEPIDKEAAQVCTLQCCVKH